MYTFQMIIDRLNSSLILKGEILPQDLIGSVRIASEEPMQEHILYLSPDRKKNTTCCRTVTGSMLLYNADLATGLNRILEVFEYYHTILSLYLLYIFSWTLTGVAEIVYFVYCYRKQISILSSKKYANDITSNK